MGKKSRQKKIRRALRPLMESAVERARSSAREDPRNWNIVPELPEPVSQQDEPYKPSLLIAPTAAETAVVERSRR